MNDSSIPWLVTLGNFFEGATVLHNVALAPNVVKVMVGKVDIGDVAILVPTDEVIIVTHAFHTFVA